MLTECVAEKRQVAIKPLRERKDGGVDMFKPPATILPDCLRICNR